MPLAVTESTFLIVTSLVMSSFVIANAYYQKNQFYPSVVYITKSNASMAIIYVQGLVLVLLLGKLMRKIFFGQLRTAEMEHLIERSWYAVTETCLAFTVFRDDLSPKFVALFTLLLFLKCFHWLAEDRVDYMERSPNISVLFHVRVVSLLAILGLLDITFVYMAYHSTLTKGASVQLVFGFEYAILFAIIINISMKYILHFFDLYNENPWEDKAIYLLYTELIMGLLKICLYFIFIVIMMKIHTFPLFAIRPMYLTMRGFKKALNDVIMSRRAIHHMNTLYPDATPQDIENSDNVCIICRENMIGNGSCKKLPCNHIFHVTCLRSWFQRQQTCPTCRMDVLGASSQRPGNANDAVANNNNNNNNQVANNNNNPNGLGHVPPIPPMFPAHPMMFQHFQNLFQRQNNQQNGPNNENNNNGPNAANPGNQGAGAAAAAAVAGSSGSANAPAGSGFVPPPPMTIPIPPPVFANAFYSNMQSPPFPMPQLPIEALLQGFSDQELRVLEGSERQNIEARIKCLMDVKTLINAATFRLQQYNNVLINSQSNASASTQTDAALFEPPTSNASRNSSSPVNVDSVPSTSVGNSGDQNDDKEMIRQRRLQRFTQAADNSESSSSVMPDTTAQNEN